MKTKLTKIYKAPRPKRGQAALPRITARADDAFGKKNYAEFSVTKKKEGRYALARVLMIFFYIFATLAYIIFCSAVKIFLWFLVALPVFVMLIIYLTWWRVSIDYKYTVDHAVFCVKAVYGDRYERVLFEEKIREISLIAPYKDDYVSQVNGFVKDAEAEYAISSKKADDIYFACHTDAFGKKKIVFFEMTSQALSALKYYNSNATVSSDPRR